MSEAHPTGLFGLLKRLGDRAVGTVQNRLELFAIELKEEKCRIIQAILLVSAVIALGVTTLALLTFTVVILFWENGRVTALCGLSGLYILATVLALRSLRRLLTTGPAFEGTLEELKKDRACLQSTN